LYSTDAFLHIASHSITHLFMQYTISYQHAASRFIQISCQVNTANESTVNMQLAAWRPGRYELQNFAKNIRNFSVTDSDGNLLSWSKFTKDRWQIDTANAASIVVTYEYYANQPDAGGSYVCEEYLYINPVNCLMYKIGAAHQPIVLNLEVPPSYQVATQLQNIDGFQFQANNFDYLADSPIIASDSLQHHTIVESYNNQHYTIHLWFQGKHPFDIKRLLDDTRNYTMYQIECMQQMPCVNFHFLYLMHDKPFRHGVEHLDSTVIAMGQLDSQTVEEYYHDLLAISSHEFFHLWNIKRIRPSTMLPYDFTKENYSTLGYIYEGITTYLGDLFLLHAGVWNVDQYLASLSADFEKHFNNGGRFNYSVAQSSFDTWLDGYVPGVPERKVSIYTEGLVAAWIADAMLLKSSGKRLTDVMRELCIYCGNAERGYDEQMYVQLLQQAGACDWQSYFNEIINGQGKWDLWIEKAKNILGVEINTNAERRVQISVVHESETLTKEWLGI
jgi:predicted metalloprotease with PDZ domain